VGREYLFKDKKPATPKKVLVVGAGPAGCEFAVQAAERGHKVTIWEKNNEIGGQLPMVSAAPGKQEFTNLTRYYKAMIAKNKIGLQLGKAADAKEIAQGGFDVVVTATGIIPNEISLPGKKTIPVYSAYDVLQDKVIPGANVVVVGGGTVGCEAAQYMAHDAGTPPEAIIFLLEHQAEKVEKVLSLLNVNRRKISIVDIVPIWAGFAPGTSWPVMKDLGRLGVKQYSMSPIKEVTDNSVIITVTNKETKERSDMSIPCDCIVMAVGAKPNNALYSELKALGVNVHNLGDSDKVGNILDAIRQAEDLAYSI
jgi:2,4-dienoyl-CoA reductase (NADPH2)